MQQLPAQDMVKVWVQLLIVLVQIGKQAICTWATAEYGRQKSPSSESCAVLGEETKNTGDFHQLVIVVLAMEERLLSEYLQGQTPFWIQCFELG